MPATDLIEKLALSLGTADQIKALADADLAAVYLLVCNRKTTRGKTRDDMVWAVADDLLTFRRRHIKAQWAALGTPVI